MSTLSVPSTGAPAQPVGRSDGVPRERTRPSPAGRATSARSGDAFEQEPATSPGPSPVPATLPELGSIASTSQTTIAALKDRVGALQAEITILEGQVETKAHAIQALISRIEARKGEIERNRENKRTIGIFGALFGMPMVAAVSLIQMYEDDDRLRSLNLELNRLEGERSGVLAKVSQQKQVRDTLEGKLEKLQAVAAELDVGGTTDGPQTKKKAFAPVAAKVAELRRYEKLKENLEMQVALLEEIRDSLSELGLELDGLLQKLSTQLVKVEEMVVASQRSLFELIKIVTAKDPQAAAEKWLSKAIATRTEKLLDELGLSMKGFIRDLVRDAFPGQADSPAAEILRKQLETALIRSVSPGPSGVG